MTLASIHPEAPWSQRPDAVLSHFEVDADTGLSPTAAQRRLKQYGPNRLRAAAQASTWAILLD